MDFSVYLQEKAAECDLNLDKYLSALKDDRTDLYEWIRYSISSGGKRLRMIVLMESAKLFSDSRNIADCVPFACAVEMIHTYSLIHDDLPAMDNAEYRRGRLSNHKMFGECAAILAGDGLLHYAFEIMSGAPREFGYEKSQLYMKALYEIAQHSGISGMVLGQAIDTLTTEAKDIELLKFIYFKKTAAMFIGSMKAGAIIADATDDAVEAVAAFAYNLGMAFQIIDDILDETGSFEALGKKAGNDKDNDKLTISSLMGIEEAGALAANYINTAVNTIRSIDKNGFFIKLCDYIINRNS